MENQAITKAVENLSTATTKISKWLNKAQLIVDDKKGELSVYYKGGVANYKSDKELLDRIAKEQKDLEKDRLGITAIWDKNIKPALMAPEKELLATIDDYKIKLKETASEVLRIEAEEKRKAEEKQRYELEKSNAIIKAKNAIIEGFEAMIVDWERNLNAKISMVNKDNLKQLVEYINSGKGIAVSQIEKWAKEPFRYYDFQPTPEFLEQQKNEVNTKAGELKQKYTDLAKEAVNNQFIFEEKQEQLRQEREAEQQKADTLKMSLMAEEAVTTKVSVKSDVKTRKYAVIANAELLILHCMKHYLREDDGGYTDWVEKAKNKATIGEGKSGTDIPGIKWEERPV